MLNDLDETLRQLLIAEIPIKNGEVEISFAQPKREWSARLNRPTVNLFLYDVRENVVLRQHQWERVADGQGNSQSSHLKRSPFRVDCYYILTTWAAEPEDEHRLLTRCLLALFRNPILAYEKLVGNLKGQPFEIQTKLAAHDKLTNPADLWSSLDNEMRPTISYLVTLALDPWVEVTGPLVRTLTLRSGQANPLPRSLELADEGESAETTRIGGTVWDKLPGGEPLAGIEVAVKGTGLFTITYSHGRFNLGSLPPGAYTLIAWAPKGKPRERKVTLPLLEGDYDLALE
jgi:hypothetical protein